jgi:hypothetical protein
VEKPDDPPPPAASSASSSARSCTSSHRDETRSPAPMSWSRCSPNGRATPSTSCSSRT